MPAGLAREINATIPISKSAVCLVTPRLITSNFGGIVMTGAGKDVKPTKSLPVPNGDFYQITECLSEAERDKLKQVRGFMETNVAPIINKYSSEVSFPFELLPGIRDLEIAGLGYEGYGWAACTLRLPRLVAMEITR